eukprot:158309-Rhodomonas_salina.1
MVAWQGKFSFQCIFFIALLTQEAHQYAAVMSAGPPHIAVVGSSVGGLSAAVALRSKGFSVEVFEKASALLPVGATIGLATNGLAALNFVSKRAHDKLCSQLDAEAVRVVRDINGDVISQTNRPGTSKTVLWHSLQQSLLGDLPNDQLNLGHEFLRYEQEDDHIRSTFRLGDGTERTYISDALIGADGVSSQVRTAMLGDVPLNFYNKFIFRAILDRPPTVSVPERSFNIWKSSVPGQQLSIISFGATARAFALSGSKSVECCIDSEDKPAQKEWIQSQFANYPATLRDVIASAAAESIHLAKIADIDMLPTWTRGPVALLGDAAHAMTPGTVCCQRWKHAVTQMTGMRHEGWGQGASMAIEDALELSLFLESSFRGIPLEGKNLEGALDGQDRSSLPTEPADSSIRMPSVDTEIERSPSTRTEAICHGLARYQRSREARVARVHEASRRETLQARDAEAFKQRKSWQTRSKGLVELQWAGAAGCGSEELGRRGFSELCLQLQPPEGEVTGPGVGTAMLSSSWRWEQKTKSTHSSIMKHEPFGECAPWSGSRKREAEKQTDWRHSSSINRRSTAGGGSSRPSILSSPASFKFDDCLRHRLHRVEAERARGDW